ncbi:hypothetical protein KHQ81_12000 [Mycoplasmatota bacterium]|nr:hypothetical protein KHQ81_12000 [Mycoplasmatota bacterium]
MDFLLEIVIELVGGILEGVFSEIIGDKNRGTNSLDKTIEINSLDETSYHESYIAGLLATTIAISYADDHKLDKEEKKMINHFIKNYKYDLSKKAKKNIKYIRRHKISRGNLNLIYIKLNIDGHMILKITNDIEHILKHSNKDISKQMELINEIRNANGYKF